MNISQKSSAPRRKWEEVAISDIEMQPTISSKSTGSSHSVVPRKLTRTAQFDNVSSSAFLHPHLPKEYNKFGSAFADVSQRAQTAGAPLFIPTFTGLRRTIVEHLTSSLHQREEEISKDKPDSEEQVLKAINLLTHMGRSWPQT
jgi:hypothetical protein